MSNADFSNQLMADLSTAESASQALTARALTARQQRMQTIALVVGVSTVALIAALGVLF